MNGYSIGEVEYVASEGLASAPVVTSCTRGACHLKRCLPDCGVNVIKVGGIDRLVITLPPHCSSGVVERIRECIDQFFGSGVRALLIPAETRLTIIEK